MDVDRSSVGSRMCVQLHCFKTKTYSTGVQYDKLLPSGPKPRGFSIWAQPLRQHRSASRRRRHSKSHHLARYFSMATAAADDVADDGEDFDIVADDASRDDDADSTAGTPELGRWWKNCERCGRDRRLIVYPHGYWYCEWNPDPTAERCEPTALVPLRQSRTVTAKSTSSQPNLFMSEPHIQEMIDAFPRLKKEDREQEFTLASGWIAVYRKRKRGDGGDVYLKMEGENALRSAADVRRRMGC